MKSRSAKSSIPIPIPIPISIFFLLISYFLTGCSPSSTPVIRMDIGGPVRNLDPQFATDPTARMVLANLFEGLMVKSPDGSVRPGAAGKAEVSASGLVYTFTLREDARWQDGEPVTAQDFIFAFQRLFSPYAPSPFARYFLDISNAGRVMDGTASLTDLGVNARGPGVVVFTLERPNPDFLQLLAGTPALPCNRRAFEESRGRYGLETRYVFSNGPFILRQWDNARFLHLDRNEQFREEKKALPGRVTLYIGRENPVKQFLDGRSDLVLIPSERLGEVSERQADFIPVERTVWALVFNQNAPPWGNPLLRQSLAMTIDRTLYEEALPYNLRATGAFIPPAMLSEGESFRALAGSPAPLEFNAAHGHRIFRRGLEIIGDDRLPETTLITPEAHAPRMESVQAGWIRHLNADVEIVPAPPAEISERLRTGNYSIMLMPFSAAQPSPGALLQYFHSTVNRFGYNNPRFDHTLAAAQGASPRELARFYKTAENMLLEDAALIPVYFETSYYALTPGLTGVEIFPFGGKILFQNAQKE